MPLDSRIGEGGHELSRAKLTSAFQVVEIGLVWEWGAALVHLSRVAIRIDSSV